MLFSTVLGGPNDDARARVAVDSAGGIYGVGDGYDGPGFPLKNAVQPTFGGGTSDAVVFKMSELPVPPTPIPTLSEWGVLLLALLLLAAGLWILLQRRIA